MHKTKAQGSTAGKIKQVAKSKGFVDRLQQDYPQFKFKPSRQEYWSPRIKTIFYIEGTPEKKLKCGLLHELAHGILEHKNYSSDFELLRMETAAWQLAAKLGKKYGVKIGDDYIQNCLDTYRDWLHRRSTCPSCGTHVVQQNSNTYKCFNCQASWRVSSGRFVRPYRRKFHV